MMVFLLGGGLIATMLNSMSDFSVREPRGEQRDYQHDGDCHCFQYGVYVVDQVVDAGAQQHDMNQRAKNEPTGDFLLGFQCQLLVGCRSVESAGWLIPRFINEENYDRQSE